MANEARITLAKTAGFCFGVDRAVRMTYDLVAEGKRVATLGQLIHNPQVVDDLHRKGARTISEPEQAQSGETVVIRAHGVAPTVVQKLQQSGIEFVDATCPFVR